MNKPLKAAVLLVLVFLVLTTFIGCYHPKPFLPYESFGSLQELEKSIDSKLPIIFPDTAKYQFVDDSLYWKVYKSNYTNVVAGYNYEGDLDATKSNTCLRRLSIGCRILNKAYNKSNPPPTLNMNIKVLGNDVAKQIEYLSDDTRYPAGSKVVNYIYEFDFSGNRYSFGGTLVISPDTLKTLDEQGIKNVVQKGNEEMLDLVKSILEKK
jgi:hypothetical protein